MTSRRRPGRRAAARWRSSPSIRGIRMSIRTTSGRVARRPRRRPRRRRPPRRRRSMLGAPPRIIDRPARTSGSSSTISTRTGATASRHRPGPVMPATGSQARSWKSPSGVRPCSSRAAGEARPARCSPTRPGAGAGMRRPRATPTAAGCAPRRSSPAPAAPSMPHVDRRARGVLAGVRQPFLDDPVRGAPDRRRDRAPVGDAGTQRAPACRPRGLLHQLGQVGQRRLGPRRAAPSPGRRAARRSPRAGPPAPVGAGPDHAGRPGDLAGGRVGAELQRPGVHAQQRDPVRQHVVHLPGDPGALELPGLLDPQLLLRLGALARVPAARRTSCRRARTNIPHATIADGEQRPRSRGPRRGRLRSIGPDARRSTRVATRAPRPARRPRRAGARPR